MTRPKTQKYVLEVLAFQTEDNLVRSHMDGMFKQTRRMRVKGPRHMLVLHFEGDQASIRACDRWRIRKMSSTDLPAKKKGVVEHHFICSETESVPTADDYRMHNGHVRFFKKVRRNAGTRKQRSHARRAMATA